MAFSAGHFYITGGGTYSVTNVGFDPQAVFFFGGNNSAEDTVVQGGNPAVFFGMMWTVIGGGIDYEAISNGNPGVRWQQMPITCISSGSGVDYEAGSGSMGSDSFSVNVTTAPSGTRLIHYLAMGEFDGCAGSTIATSGDGVTVDFTLGFRPLSTVLMNMFASGSAHSSHNVNANYFALGVANWPGFETVAEVDANNNNAGADTFQRGDDQIGTNNVQFQLFDTTITPGVKPEAAQSYNDVYDHMFPIPTYIGTNARVIQWTSVTRGSVLFTTCEGSVHGVNSPDVGLTNTYTARSYIDDIEAVLFFGPAGYDHGSTINTDIAYTYGVLTEDYQGCVAYDRGANNANDPCFFQSKQLCHATSLYNGVRASSGEIVGGNQVVLTGEIASTINNHSCIMQMWGRDIELQQFFRVLHKG